IALWGVAIAGFGLLGQQRLVGLLLLAVAGAADLVSAIFRQTILQLTVPDRLRGRVTALNSMITQTGPQLGNFEAGTVAALTTPVISVVSGGVLSVLAIVLLALASPSLRNYRRHDATGAARDDDGIGANRAPGAAPRRPIE
ncbi:MAG: MFS transporter, partial [Nitrososphaerales archaeon]